MSPLNANPVPTDAELEELGRYVSSQLVESIILTASSKVSRHSRNPQQAQVRDL